MKRTWRAQFGFWLERFRPLRPLLFKETTATPWLHVNRINGHVVAMNPRRRKEDA